MYFIPISLIHMYICKYSIFCIIYHIYVQLLRSTAAPWQVEFPSLWSFQPPFCRSKTMTMTTLPKSVEGQQKNTVGNDGGNTNFSQKYPGGLEPKQGKCPDCSSLGIIVYPPKFNMDEDDDIKVRSLLFLRGLCSGVSFRRSWSSLVWMRHILRLTCHCFRILVWIKAVFQGISLGFVSTSQVE